MDDLEGWDVREILSRKILSAERMTVDARKLETVDFARTDGRGQLSLRLCLRLQLHMTTLHFHAVFDRLAAILFANLRSFLLDE